MAEHMTWAFIHLSINTNPDVDRVEMEYFGNRLLICGTDTVEGGCNVAKYLVEEENCTRIELCGGWHADGAELIAKTINNRIPVGHVEYLPSEFPKMTKEDNQYVPWAFLSLTGGTDKEVRHIVVPHGKNRLLIYITGTIEKGCEVARQIVDAGCELVELGGGYGSEGAQRIIDSIDGRVPVGHMVYPDTELADC